MGQMLFGPPASLFMSPSYASNAVSRTGKTLLAKTLARLGTNDELGRKAILKLTDAVDEYITDPVRQVDKPFLMPVEDVFSIQVVAKPGTLKTYKRFEAEIYVLTKDEGGRHTAFFLNYMPQFYMRTADITGKVELPENVKMVMPGDNVTAVFELLSAVPLEAGKMLTDIRRISTISGD
ncbi:hypothetical protein RHGRI_003360 [Rhododendron griersonianum]|uniref:Translation elongation factor EFTu/EF1A C-terminal domain-containing protein n=1 Tax=Rhododendron griersonianum TaxID=479676 RepID=A0AAV6L585_9ERIC|nr:hypothetical protein RHGRI_003360 [Rhododendron griersonianum]